MFCGNPLSAVHKSTATRAEAGNGRQKSRTQVWRSCGKAKRAVALSSSAIRGVRSSSAHRTAETENHRGHRSRTRYSRQAVSVEKARLKFGKTSWIILYGRPYYILGSPESSRYTI